jgi:hypothetical protein
MTMKSQQCRHTHTPHYVCLYIYIFIYFFCVPWSPQYRRKRRRPQADIGGVWGGGSPPRKSGGSVLTLFHSIRIPRRSHFYITCVSLRFHSDFKPLRHVDCTSSNFVSISLRCSLPGSGAGWLSKMMPAL